MKHIEKHHSRYSPEQLFDLVVDVDQYPNFLPWVITARVTGRRDRMMWVAMTMGTSLLNKHFTTKAFLTKPHRVEINSYDPMFECFDQVWTFEPAPEGGTNAEYRVDIRFKSQMLQLLFGVSFAERTKAMVKAYMRRAQYLYGAPQPALQEPHA
jgi:coenzyme Q-binding protein COQ10